MQMGHVMVSNNMTGQTGVLSESAIVTTSFEICSFKIWVILVIQEVSMQQTFWDEWLVG